jgi:hypothetical protein
MGNRRVEAGSEREKRRGKGNEKDNQSVKQKGRKR